MVRASEFATRICNGHGVTRPQTVHCKLQSSANSTCQPIPRPPIYKYSYMGWPCQPPACSPRRPFPTLVAVLMSDPLSLRRTCRQFRAQSRLNRRGFVHAGVLGTAGLTLVELLRTEAIAAPASSLPAGRLATSGRTASSSCGCAAGRATSTCGTPSPTPRPSTAASSARSPPTSPGIQLTDMLPMCGDHGQVVDRPQPAPPRRRPLDRRPDLLHRLQPRPQPRRERPSQLRLDRRRAARPPEARAAGLRDDPADGARHRLGLPRRRAQAVRDAADPANAGPFRVPNFQLADGLTVERLGDRGGPAARTSTSSGPRSTPAARSRRWTASASRRGRCSPRPPRRRRSTSTASRKRSASATASCRRSIPARPTAAAPGLEPADAARPAAGRSGRAAGDGRSALVGHARARASSRCAAASCRAGTGPTRR